MTKESKRLIEAFAVKDEIEGFLTNLEQLKADGSVTEEQYIATRQEYYRRLGLATSDIARIKNELKEQLEANQRHVEARRHELGNLEVKHRVGELSLERYQSSERKLRTDIQKLERYSEVLTVLIQASSAADIGAPARKPKVPPAEIGVPAKKPVAAAPEPLPPSKAAPPAKAAAPGKKGQAATTEAAGHRRRSGCGGSHHCGSCPSYERRRQRGQNTHKHPRCCQCRQLAPRAGL